MQVMTSTAASAATQTETETAKTSASTLDYNAFLGLLIAELKNQDPTKPMDSAQYIAQLASFSNVEQSVKANAKLDSLISAQQLSQERTAEDVDRLFAVEEHGRDALPRRYFDAGIRRHRSSSRVRNGLFAASDRS